MPADLTSLLILIDPVNAFISLPDNVKLPAFIEVEVRLLLLISLGTSKGNAGEVVLIPTLLVSTLSFNKGVLAC